MEQVPKKKARRGISPKRAVLLLLCACAVIGGAAAWVRSLNRLPEIPEAGETFMLLPRPADEVQAIEIIYQDSPAYTLENRDGSFALKGKEQKALKETYLEELTLSVGKVPAAAVVLPEMNAEQGVNPAAFGLETPYARVKITYQDGEQREMLLGNAAFNQDTPQRYCALTGDHRLYTILEADCEIFFHDADYLIAFDQPTLDGSLLDRIEVTGEVTFTASYTPTGWQMEAPFVYPLSVQRMDSLLSRIESMGFEACLGSEEELDLTAYGLAEPAVTVKLIQAATVITGETSDGQQVSIPRPETEYVLRLGNETGKSGVYLLWKGQVYRASNFVLGFWKTLEPRSLVLTNPVNFLVNNLEELRFTAQGITRIYEVRMVESITENNQIAVDEYGQTLYDLAVRRAGETEDMNAEAFSAWYQQLATLSGDGNLPEGFTLTGESRASILLKNDHLSRLIEFYPYDALHDALAVDGVALFYVQKDWLNRVMDAP